MCHGFPWSITLDSNVKQNWAANAHFLLPVIPFTHTVVQPLAMVVEVVHTLVAEPTVLDFGPTAGKHSDT